MLRQVSTVALAVLVVLGNLTLAAAQESKGQHGTGHILPSPFQTPRESTEAGGHQQIANSIGMKLTLIPAGEFPMGSGESAEETSAFFKQAYGWDLKPERYKAEHPQHRVRITAPFYLGTYHVTRGQFRQFVEATHYKTDAETDTIKGALGYVVEDGTFSFKKSFWWQGVGFDQTDEHPVLCVSWNDAKAFCNWLSGKEGKTYRLPTEAEWEYACRAGTTTRYYSGDDPETLAQVGNVIDAKANERFHGWGWTYTIRANDGYVFTAPVGSFKPNAFGLYDMHGNARQWCADWFGADYYATSPTDDPQGPGSGTERVLRGGSWVNGPDMARCADRFGYAPTERASSSGFRVARAP